MTPACSASTSPARSRHSHEHEHRDDLPTPGQVCQYLIRKTELGEIAWLRTSVTSWQGQMGSARLVLDERGLLVLDKHGLEVVAIHTSQTPVMDDLIEAAYTATCVMAEPERTSWYRQLGGMGR